MNAFASALALLRVCSAQPLSVQLDALSDGDPLPWIACLQQQQQGEPLLGVSPLRQLRLSNDDCLYVFATLLLEQFRWEPALQREQEQLALLRAFRDLGHAMNIQKIPCTIEALEGFQHQYEDQHCCYAACNDRLAQAIGDDLIRRLPGILRPLGSVGMSALLDERVRAALGLRRLHPSFGSTVRWVITTYQHRTPRAVKQRTAFEQQATPDEQATLLFLERRSDPVNFLFCVLCFARYAPPIVINEPQVPPEQSAGG